MFVEARIQHDGAEYVVSFITCNEEYQPDDEHGLPYMVAYDFRTFRAWNSDGDPILSGDFLDALRKKVYEADKVWASINDSIVDVIGEG